MSSLPFSEACERNKDPILVVLREVFADRSKVLEIGSGTGQHAVHFAADLSHLTWQPTELPDNLFAVQTRRDEARLAELLSRWPPRFRNDNQVKELVLGLIR